MLAFAASGCGSNREPSRAPSDDETPDGAAGPTFQAPAGTYDLSVQSPQFVAYGADAGDFTHGFSSLAGGDFNGDGSQDLLIGAPFADGPSNSRKDGGEAYVIFGRSELSGTIDLAQGQQDVIIFGATAGDNLGLTVLAADINGDGLDDIIVGAPGVTVFGGRDERTQQGRTYVFFGSTDLAPTQDVGADPEAFDFVITGAEGFSHIGHALATGDINGDGVDDLILGAPFAGREPGSPPGSPRKESGEVYVIYGSASLAGELHIALDPVGFMASSDQRHGQFGAAVASGDVNGDGFDDVIAGAPQLDFENRETAGAVYVFFGASDLSGRRSIDAGEQDAALIGATAGHSLGFPVSSGDINGDGVDDIIAGARGAAGPDNQSVAAGAAFVLFGRTGLAGDHDLAAVPPDSVIHGASAGNLLPAAISTSDVVGDNADEILLTTATGPSERPQAGGLYIIPGVSTFPALVDLSATQVAPAILGAQEGDALGSALAVLPPGGESSLAFLLLASRADGPDEARVDAGEIYLVHGASVISTSPR